MVVRKRNSQINVAKKEESKKKPNFGDIQIKTYQDEVIEVLSILDNKDVNIYDESRYGGMYLEDVKSSSVVKKLFDSKKSDENTNEKIDEKAPENLLNFFRNNKTK